MGAQQAQQWTSRSIPAARGLEFGYGQVSISALRQEMACFDHQTIAGADFLLFPIATTDRDGLSEAACAVQGIAREIHVCLLIDELTLECVESGDWLPRGMGLGLDKVSRKTSVGALAKASIEAVRFSSEFVVAAADDLRLATAIQALVSLANDLGLRTLGPRLEAQSTLGCECRFDYVSEGLDPRPCPFSRRSRSKLVL